MQFDCAEHRQTAKGYGRAYQTNDSLSYDVVQGPVTQRLVWTRDKQPRPVGRDFCGVRRRFRNGYPMG